MYARLHYINDKYLCVYVLKYNLDYRIRTYAHYMNALTLGCNLVVASLFSAYKNDYYECVNFMQNLC